MCIFLKRMNDLIGGSMFSLENMIGHLKCFLFYKWKFMNIGNKSLLIKPLKIDNPCSISIGNNTYIAHYSWLMGSGIKEQVSLEIGNNIQIGHFAHIIGMWKVIIEDFVLLADKVYISDCGHSYEEIISPIVTQELKNLGPVIIGRGSWIGENVCIYGASVGRHCVIGANSVVITDIPDYSVAVGAPARVIKRYNFQSGQWKKIDEE